MLFRSEQIVLSLEYDPSPISGGVPETARPEVVDAAKTRIAALNNSSDHIKMIDEAAARFSL